MTDSSENESTEISFEEAYRKLEQTVEELGGGGLSLERATVLYEEGMKLVQVCNQRLSAAELRVTQLKDSYSSPPDVLPDDDDQNC